MIHLPTLNACLNALSGLFVLIGWWAIRRDQTRTHIVSMICAVITSSLFLASYLTYHVLQHGGVTRFTGTGPIRPVYFSLLISHTLLAAVIPPLVVLTLIPALRSRFDQHVRIARWTLPLWLYVSVTGVLVYLMLYHWFRPA
jgi:uncharacterized membrane protein YozB (DUF420 family)